MSNESKDPKEVQEMKTQLVELRRRARGVKDSARHLRITTSRSLRVISDAAVLVGGDQTPDRDEETTRRIVGRR